MPAARDPRRYCDRLHRWRQVSASVFPRYGLAAAAFADIGGHPSALAMRRITKGYGRLAIITSVVGLVLSLLMGRLAEP